MTRPASSKASRELDSITSSLLEVRILHYASGASSTAAALADRLHQHGGPISRTTPSQILARMTRTGLLNVKPAPTRRTGDRSYSLTPKGRRMLSAAKQHLQQLFANWFTKQKRKTEPP